MERAALELTETKRTDSPSFNTVRLDFDAKNTSSEDYDITKGSRSSYWLSWSPPRTGRSTRVKPPHE